MRILIILVATFVAIVFMAGCPKGNLRVDNSSSLAPSVASAPVEPSSGGVMVIDLDNTPMQYEYGGRLDETPTVFLNGKSIVRVKHKLSINEKGARGILVETVDAMNLRAFKNDSNGKPTQFLAEATKRDVSTDDYLMVEFNVPPSSDLLMLNGGDLNVLFIEP